MSLIEKLKQQTPSGISLIDKLRGIEPQETQSPEEADLLLEEENYGK